MALNDLSENPSPLPHP